MTDFGRAERVSTRRDFIAALAAMAAAPSWPALAKDTTKPKIALVIDDMGLDIQGSARATRLPSYVTLSFLPYANHLTEQAGQARKLGHELILHMPMEPVGHADPGPGALLTVLPPNEIKKRLDAALDCFRGLGIDGINNHMGSKFTSNAADMQIVIDELKARGGLFFFDSFTIAGSVGAQVARAEGVPTIRRDVFLDDVISPGMIDRQLAGLERMASKNGHAVAIGHPHKETLGELEKWLPAAEARGYQFVPLRELVRLQL